MDLEKFLKDAGVTYVKHEHPTAYTAQELAAEEHVTGNRVAKAVVVRAGKRHVLCVLPASYKIDMGKLGKVLSVDECHLVGETEMGQLFPDVEVGAEPPFGKSYGLQTVVDAHLSTGEKIFFTSGTHRQAIEMSYADYVRLAEPLLADFSSHL
jgi:Ala-tRNA(Pro) deacylase